MSNWVTIADESDAKWVGTIVSLALTLRFVIAARGLIIRGLVLMAALVKFTVALAKGEKKSVKVLQLKEQPNIEVIQGGLVIIITIAIHSFLKLKKS